MANPTKLSWRAPTENTDGSPFTVEQYHGFELQVNEGPDARLVSVPAVWETDGLYELPLADFVTESGSYTLIMRTVAKNGNVSAWSGAVSFALDFRVPGAPTGVSVSG